MKSIGYTNLNFNKMALPRKGSRVINIGETEYRYIVSGNDGHIDLIIEQDNIKGQRLIVSFEYHSKQINSKWVQRNQTTPNVIKQVIIYSLDNGWKPNQKGKEMRFNNIDDKIKLTLINE